MPAKYIAFNDALYEYMIAQRSNADDPVQKALYAETEKLGDIAAMSISPDQLSFLTLLVAAIGTKWAVEVGTFTGTSSISIARGLAPGGKLVCFDQSGEWTAIARRYWEKAGVADRIELRLGDARTTLPQFKPPAPLDFVFIDADKESYDIYYEALLPHVRPGGLILFDNMLRGGQVIDPAQKDNPSVRAIDQLNHKLAADTRVEAVLIPVADGLYICRKRGGA
jgi:caffeoyl-CoA O-methyltransferase